MKRLTEMENRMKDLVKRIHGSVCDLLEEAENRLYPIRKFLEKPVIWIVVIAIVFCGWSLFQLPKYERPNPSFKLFLTMLYETDEGAAVLTQDGKDVTKSFKKKYQSLYEKGQYEEIYDAVADGYVLSYSSHVNYYYYAYLNW